jgi:hypothetical protein
LTPFKCSSWPKRKEKKGAVLKRRVSGFVDRNCILILRCQHEREKDVNSTVTLAAITAPLLQKNRHHDAERRERSMLMLHRTAPDV